MKEKKSTKVNLERKKFLFFEIGLILALGICFLAFEWNSQEVVSTNFGKLEMTTEFEQEIINTYEEPPVEDEKIVEPEMVIEKLVVVDDNKDVEKIDFNSEVKDTSAIKIVTTIEDIPDEKTEVINFAVVEKKPLFPGGDIELLRYITSNTTYPPIPKENNIEGKVYVSFVIGKDGKVRDAKVIHGVDPYLDAEALRVIKTLPDWEPGRQGGIADPVLFILTIKFGLY
jgi:protein TonB